MPEQSKSSKGPRSALTLVLVATLAAAIAWYYDAYVNWQSRIRWSSSVLASPL